MKKYIVIEIDDEDSSVADTFAENIRQHLHLDVEVLDFDEYNFSHMYKDVELVVEEYMDLTAEQKAIVDIQSIVNQLFDYDYSDYNDYIEQLVYEQLKEELS